MQCCCHVDVPAVCQCAQERRPRLLAMMQLAAAGAQAAALVLLDQVMVLGADGCKAGRLSCQLTPSFACAAPQASASGCMGMLVLMPLCAALPASARAAGTSRAGAGG